MPLIDNRPNTDGATGGPADIIATKNAIKSDWKVVEHAITALDIGNGYITLPSEPQDLKVLVTVLGGGEMDKDVDFTINKPTRRVIFSVDLHTQITNLFNTYGNVVIKAAYFAAS